MVCRPLYRAFHYTTITAITIIIVGSDSTALYGSLKKSGAPHVSTTRSTASFIRTPIQRTPSHRHSHIEITRNLPLFSDQQRIRSSCFFVGPNEEAKNQSSPVGVERTTKEMALVVDDRLAISELSKSYQNCFYTLKQYLK